MLSRFTILLPLVLSLVAFVLTNLCLFAGRNKGFMEDYAIARLNTSMLGYNMLDVDSSSSSDDDDNDDDGSIWDAVKDEWDDIKDEIKNEVNNITNEIADELADALGISEWYSIHVMDTCEGYFKPNATAPGAGLNVTNCTQSAPEARFNITKLLSHELSVGPFDLSLDDLGWSSDIEDAVDSLNDALLGLFILYVLGIGFSGLAMFGCVAAFFLPGRGFIMVINQLLSTLAALSILTGSIIVTVAANKGVKKINRHGEDIGLSATKGNKLITLTWISFAFMTVAALYWLTQKLLTRRQWKREMEERKGSY